MFSVLTSLHSVQNVTLSAQNVTLSAQNVTLSAQNVTLSAQNVTLSAQNVILLIIGRYYKTLSTKLSVGPLPITHLEVLSVKSNPRICTLRTSLFIMTSMLPLLNYQSYKITFTIMISLLSIPFPE